ncbi:MAG TPA: PEP-CTERM sorting domain-containing protein [Pyrinomonadaceae bacterium]
MTRSRVLTGIISAVFFLTLVSSARADRAHGNLTLEKLIFAERHNLTDIDLQTVLNTDYEYVGHFENNNGKHLGFRNKLTDIDVQRVADTSYLFAAKFENNNNGKHRGFSVAAVHNGPRLGIVRQIGNASVSQNPEPTAMVLLGSGLAAAAAFARKLKRRRNH